MPTVAMIDGIKILFYNDEHPPPHFHAAIAGYEAQISIETLEILEGRLRKAHHRKVKEWAQTRRQALRQAWDVCLRDQNPGKID